MCKDHGVDPVAAWSAGRWGKSSRDPSAGWGPRRDEGQKGQGPLVSIGIPWTCQQHHHPSPGHSVQGLSVGAGHEEADRGDDSLSAAGPQHPPLVGLGIAEQGTCVVLVHRDLWGRGSISVTQGAEGPQRVPPSQLSLTPRTSICL